MAGIHPRFDATIQATQDWERRRLAERLLEVRFAKDVAGLVSLQGQLGFDYLSDGQLSMWWQDIFRPFTENVRGLRKGPLMRWYNTNTFYYAPVVEERLHSDGGALEGKIDATVLASGKGRIALPDPLTFLDCCEDKRYVRREKLMLAYCDRVLGPTLRRLSKKGLSYVQFSAPALVARFRREKVGSDELSLLGEGLRSALKGTTLSSGYHTFFGDAAPYLPRLFDVIPTNDLGFDLSETDPARIDGDRKKGVIAGAADSRNSYVESPAELAKKVEVLKDRFKRVTLSPSADLQHVPRPVADEKLKNLARARRLLSG